MVEPKKTDNSQLEVCARLRDAINRSGGIPTVAKSANVPVSTLHDYLNGTDIKLSRGARIAAACGISLDWLATGANPEEPSRISENSIFGRDILESSVNFSALLILIRSCQDAYTMTEKPVLRAVFEWVSPPYRIGHKLAEVKIEFKTGDDLK